MKTIPFIMFIFVLVSCNAQPVSDSISDHTNSKKMQNMDIQNNWNPLTDEEKRVIINKGTEYPFSNEYHDNKDSGLYQCKQCNQPLFESNTKFNSGTGWPSFDDAIAGAVQEVPDRDGRRIEIVCSNCKGHLGHVFKGEQLTDKNTRHCVNSISLSFIPATSVDGKDSAVAVKEETAYFASGCFWGTEYYLQQQKGVISTQVGYMGGTVKNPSYKEVCTGRTGHAEVVKVVYNSDSVSYETLARFFFETHDPTQMNRQGPDIGTQYRSEVFYTSEEQKIVTEKLISLLKGKGFKVVTNVTPANDFWKGEEYHQNYYNGNGGTPYCHSYQKKF